MIVSPPPLHDSSMGAGVLCASGHEALGVVWLWGGQITSFRTDCEVMTAITTRVIPGQGCITSYTVLYPAIRCGTPG